MRPVITWIVVADGVRARLFVNRGVGKGIEPILDREFVGSNLPTREIGTDQPGRTFDSAGVGSRHAMEPPTDPQRYQKRLFARNMAGQLDGARKAGAFDRLVVVAPPDTLGDLRAAFSRQLQARVMGEIAKDLTKMPPGALPTHLGNVLAI